jgi:CheY-like chemotaxis protein
MEKAMLTISLPRIIKDFTDSKLREGRFSTPSEYIRSLVRDDQDVTGNKELALLIRRGVRAGEGRRAGENGTQRHRLTAKTVGRDRSGVERAIMSEANRFQILLAEDNPADIELIQEALREHGVNCSLHVTRDGAQAIAYIDTLDTNQKAPPLDLLLLDMHLPKSDGEEVLRRLRSTERYAQTPVIVMTGSDSRAIEEKAVRHAALFYFRKPSSLVEYMELGSIVRRVLAQRSDSAERARDQKNRGGAA